MLYRKKSENRIDNNIVPDNDVISDINVVSDTNITIIGDFFENIDLEKILEWPDEK